MSNEPERFQMGKKDFLNVFFFGDSICCGKGVALHKGWVPRISASLHSLGQDYGVEIVVINASANGNTTRQALERMPYDLQSHGVDLILVQFGLNDCNVWATDKGHPRVSPKAFAANLEEIMSRAITFGAKRVFLNTNHPTGRSKEALPNSTLTFDEHNRRYNQIIRSVSNMNPLITLNDLENAFDRHMEAGGNLGRLLLPDMLHLSEEGHDLYFESIAPRLKTAVEDSLAGHVKT